MADIATSLFGSQVNEKYQQDGHNQVDDEPWTKFSVILSAHPFVIVIHHWILSFSICSGCIFSQIELHQPDLRSASSNRIVRIAAIIAAVGVIRHVAATVEVLAVVIVTTGVRFAPIEKPTRLVGSAGVVAPVVVVGAANE